MAGIGQPLRRDDSVGWELLQILPPSQGLKSYWVGDDVTRVLDVMGEAEALFLVDAVRSGASPGTLHRLDLNTPLPAPTLRFSTHSLNPLEVVELARRLGREIPQALILFGLEGSEFGLGSELSDPVARALPLLLRKVEEEIAAWRG